MSRSSTPPEAYGSSFFPITHADLYGSHTESKSSRSRHPPAPRSGESENAAMSSSPRGYQDRDTPVPSSCRKRSSPQTSPLPTCLAFPAFARTPWTSDRRTRCVTSSEAETATMGGVLHVFDDTEDRRRRRPGNGAFPPGVRGNRFQQDQGKLAQNSSACLTVAEDMNKDFEEKFGRSRQTVFFLSSKETRAPLVHLQLIRWGRQHRRRRIPGDALPGRVGSHGSHPILRRVSGSPRLEYRAGRRASGRLKGKRGYADHLPFLITFFTDG